LVQPVLCKSLQRLLHPCGFLTFMLVNMNMIELTLIAVNV
jgi:hypothetical protein